MKNKILALLLAAAALGISGCSAANEEYDAVVINGSSSQGGVDLVIGSSGENSSVVPPFTSSISASGGEGSRPSESTANGSDNYSQSYSQSAVESVSSSCSSEQQSSISSSTGYEYPTSSSSSEGYVSPVITPNPHGTTNYNEVKGMWISYLELASLPSDSESEFRNSLAYVYGKCADFGINTVYVHVRSHGDAYYSSDLFPRTKYLGGSYDPLSVMVEEAHARGLSFQAWINPLRACAVSDIGREYGYKIYDWAGGERQLVEVGSYYYLNPAYDEAIRLIADGVREIVSNYDVDGLHIDDYFYPTTESYFDSEAYSQSGYDTLSAFRFNNCDKLVSAIYSAVKQSNSSALFSVSCQGSISNNYNQMYADVKKWCAESGYLDYIMPQIYYGFNNSAEPYSECLATWNNIALSGGKPLVTGITASKIGLEDVWAGEGRDEWQTDRYILMRQLSEAREQPSYGGICVYSFSSVFNNDSEQAREEIEALGGIL